MTLTPEAFWQYSVNHYGKPGVAEACLILQDNFGINVNLLLLYSWCIAHNITLTAETRNALAVSVATTNPAIEQHRVQRRQAKGTPQYNALKQQELNLEALQQQALVAVLNTSQNPVTVENDTKDTNDTMAADPIDPLERLSCYLNINVNPDITTHLQAVL
ncbi:TIGR02444 family protein [Alteromonas sp. AMM-1]|uniref:TIGR02444 family protein n=1 Tax=Alteromonas sp. AMM-1 TaxID=3394233 RepID=UPI0039A7452E